MRDFKTWLNGLRSTIANYEYYVDFTKVFNNVDSHKRELYLLNSLIGVKDIEREFRSLVKDYPNVLNCIPILIAKRELEIATVDNDGSHVYDFKESNYSIDQYCVFMRRTGLFELLENHLISNIVDYVTGVEVGLDSNGRKNRGGHLMENLVEKYLIEAGLIKDIDYFKEMGISEIEKRWGIDLSTISNQGKTEKRFDFVVKVQGRICGIETNFYSSGGSKLNETARSYKTIALETKDIDYFDFIWFTDGQAWFSAKNNLLETFEVLEHLYNIKDLENGIAKIIFK